MKSIVEARSRAQQYRFLASVYLTPPTSQLLEEMKKLGFVNGTDPKVIQQEFQNLFVIPLGQYTTPYEAVYRDEREVAGQKVRGLLMGPSTVDVIQRYRRTGAQLDQSTIEELPDHIGVELAFMEFLCEREAEALEQEKETEANELRKEQVSFLSDHLTVWLPQLAQAIREKGRLELYKRLATLTEETVREDLSSLKEAA